MGAKNDLQQSLLDSIKLMSEKIANSTDAAIVIKGEIVELLDAGKRQYSVAYGGAIYNDAYATSGVTYQPATIVYLLIPNGDFDQKKQIINSVDPSSEQYANEDIVNRNIPMSNNLFNYSGQIDLQSWKDSEDDVSTFVSGNFAQLLQNYLNLYRRILFSAEIKTEIDAAHQMGGNYGLILTIPFKNLETGEIIYRDFTMDVNTIEGNPYAFYTFQPVELYYDIDGIWECYIDDNYKPSMKSFVSDFGYSEEEKSAKDDTKTDIHIKNIQFKMVNTLTDNNLSGYYLSLIPSNGHYFNNEEYSVDKILTPKLKVNGKDTSLDNWSCYWFVEDGSINVGAEGYSRFGGIGWKCLNEKQNIQQDSDGRITFEYVTSQKTFIVKKDDVEYSARYKCVLVKDEVITNSAIVKLINLDAQCETKLESATGSNIFVEGIGNVKLKATLKYYNPGTNIFSTYWQRFDKNGNYLDDNFYTIEENTVYKDNYAIYTAEISYPCSLVDKLNLVTCMFYYSKVINEGTNDADTEQINLATESITISTSPELTYTLQILNGDVLYKYDPNGNSPMVADYDGQPSSAITDIKPITYAIYKPDGSELTPDEYMQVRYKWSFPIYSMMKFDNKGGGHVSQDETYYYIDNYTLDGSSTPYNLYYKIRETYNKKYSNNTILLEIDFNGIKLNSSITPRFIKDGESGTNGSKYAAIIEYQKHGYGELDGNGNSYKFHAVYIVDNTPDSEQDTKEYYDIGWYVYDIQNKILIPFSDADKQLTVDVYKDGGLISNTSDSYTLSWDVFDYSVTDPCIMCDSNGILKIRKNGDRDITWDKANDVYCSIIQCCVTIENDEHKESIYCYYPIEITRLQKFTKDNKIIPRLEGGFDQVLYASDGTNPQFDNSNPFECVDNIHNGNWTNYIWGDDSSPNLKYSDYIDTTELNSEGEIIYKNISYKKKVNPITQFLNGNTKNYIKVSLQYNSEYESEIEAALAKAQLDQKLAETRRDFYYKENSNSIYTKLLDFYNYLMYNKEENKTLFDIYLEELELAKPLLVQRFDILNNIISLQRQLDIIHNFAIQNITDVNDYDFLKNNEYKTIADKLLKLYKHEYLLANKITLDALSSSSESLDYSKKFTVPITINTKYGPGVYSTLISYIQEWNGLQASYNRILREITFKENVSSPYKYEDAWNALYRILYGENSDEKNPNPKIKTEQALTNLPSNTFLRQLAEAKVPPESDNKHLDEFVNLKTQLNLIMNRLKQGVETEEEIELVSLAVGNGIINSYDNYINKLINIMDNMVKPYYLLDENGKNTRQEYYKSLSEEYEKEARSLDPEIEKCTFLLSPTMVNNVIHIKPIVMIMNRYELANINGWDGSKLYIGGPDEGEYLLAPQVGAGQKEDGKFTGMVMGIRSFSKSSTRINQNIGLFGYSEGLQSLFLNAKDGSATFGLSGDGQIIIEPGEKAIIKSGNYESEGVVRYDEVYFVKGNPKEQKLYEKKNDQYVSTEDENVVEGKQYYRKAQKSGMMIDLSTPEIRFGSGKFWVKDDGSMYAQNGGQIGNWKIGSDNTLKSSNNAITLNATSEAIIFNSSNGKIYSSGHDIFKSTDNGFYLSSDGLSIGGNFSVDKSGNLIAKQITADVGGSIGGWEIDGNTLKHGNTTILDGSTGQIKCDDLEASAGGHIGGWNIGSTGLSYPSTGLTLSTTGLSGPGFSVTAKGFEASNPKGNSKLNWGDNFSVGTDGILRANGAIISGNITANDGAIGGWKINSTGLFKDETHIYPSGIVVPTISADTMTCGGENVGSNLTFLHNNKANHGTYTINLETGTVTI